MYFYLVSRQTINCLRISIQTNVQITATTATNSPIASTKRMVLIVFARMDMLGTERYVSVLKDFTDLLFFEMGHLIVNINSYFFIDFQQSQIDDYKNHMIKTDVSSWYDYNTAQFWISFKIDRRFFLRNNFHYIDVQS